MIPFALLALMFVVIQELRVRFLEKRMDTANKRIDLLAQAFDIDSDRIKQIANHIPMLSSRERAAEIFYENESLRQIYGAKPSREITEKRGKA